MGDTGLRQGHGFDFGSIKLQSSITPLIDVEKEVEREGASEERLILISNWKSFVYNT